MRRYLLLAALIALPAFAIHHEMPSLTEQLASSDRSEADRGRDAGRKPADVVAFLGIEPGMTVLDVLAAGGYYTEVLSLAVGEAGKVYSQNTAMMLSYRDGANDKALAARLAGDRLANVMRLDAEFGALGLQPGSVDVAITALNFHDIYNGAGEEAALAVSKAVYAALKPGGAFGVIDHNGDADKDNNALHRMPMADAIRVLEAAGFRVGSTDILRNRADDHAQMVFAPGIRGKTDRFVLLARKPID